MIGSEKKSFCVRGQVAHAKDGLNWTWTKDGIGVAEE